MYKIPCKDCEKAYVGQTGHSVDQRIKEHKRALASLDYSMSAVAEHAIKTDHNIGWEEFEILDSHLELHKMLFGVMAHKKNAHRSNVIAIS